MYLATNARRSHARDCPVRVRAVSFQDGEVLGHNEGKCRSAKVRHALFSTNVCRLLLTRLRFAREFAVGRYVVIWSSSSGGRSVNAVVGMVVLGRYRNRIAKVVSCIG